MTGCVHLQVGPPEGDPEPPDPPEDPEGPEDPTEEGEDKGLPVVVMVGIGLVIVWALAQ